jgi:GrpB-like predicted nucleotidyltransferase (UPF0157 family)
MPTLAESIAAGGRIVGRDRNEPIELSEYDPARPARFEEMRDRLAAALGEVALRIDHVGSTSVPGLVAKPIVDIQVSVSDVDDEAVYVAPIEALGLEMRWIETGHRYFRAPPPLPRRCQVHVCTVGSDWERRHLLFRDYLRSHPDAARDYGNLKRRLAAEHKWDRIAYTDAKGPFIDATTAKAEVWAAETHWQP